MVNWLIFACCCLLQNLSPGPRTKVATARSSGCDESSTITVMDPFTVVKVFSSFIIFHEYRVTWDTKAVVIVRHLASHNGLFDWREA
jgi:hypothetical protein